jgi:hypothetical protein
MLKGVEHVKINRTKYVEIICGNLRGGTRKVGEQEEEAKPLCVKAGCVKACCVHKFLC